MQVRFRAPLSYPGEGKARLKALGGVFRPWRHLWHIRAAFSALAAFLAGPWGGRRGRRGQVRRCPPARMVAPQWASLRPMNAPISLAASQVNRIAMLYDFLRQPSLAAAAQSASPVTMPPTLGSMGLDVPLWVGLGTVGLWSALDAYLERMGVGGTLCPVCGRATCIYGRLCTHNNASAMPLRALEELEDFRHLYAHNFAGHVDADYLLRKRHVLTGAQPVALSCGQLFNAPSLTLEPTALKHYAARVSETLVLLQ